MTASHHVRTVRLIALAGLVLATAGCFKPIPPASPSMSPNATSASDATAFPDDPPQYDSQADSPSWAAPPAEPAAPDEAGTGAATESEDVAVARSDPAEPAEPAEPAGGDLAAIPLVLPAPAFRGTPVPLEEPNVQKPSGKPREPFMAPAGTVNLALGKLVTCSDPAPTSGELDLVTDGDKEATDFGCLELHPGTEWVQIDLGQKATVWAVVLWHNHAQARVYRDVVVQVGDDPDFLEGSTVFNNDFDNSSGLGISNDQGDLDMGYVETSEGKLIDCGGLEGRYVRFYSNGNTTDAENHYTEVEVYGTAP